MRVIDITLKLLGLADVICRWQTKMSRLDKAKRAKIAEYALAIADSLSRLAAALERLEAATTDRIAHRNAVREVGRLAGYVETIVETLRGYVDGRRLAGVERRLEGLADEDRVTGALAATQSLRIERIVAAEGYMRALADGLKT